MLCFYAAMHFDLRVILLFFAPENDYFFIYVFARRTLLLIFLFLGRTKHNISRKLEPFCALFSFTKS